MLPGTLLLTLVGFGWLWAALDADPGQWWAPVLLSCLVTGLLVAWVVGAPGRIGLRLTAEGIRMPRGRRTLPWDELSFFADVTRLHVRFVTLEYPVIQVHRWNTGRSDPLRVDLLDCERAVVLNLLAHYRDRPRSRAELGSPACVDRAEQILTAVRLESGPGSPTEAREPPDRRPPSPI